MRIAVGRHHKQELFARFLRDVDELANGFNAVAALCELEERSGLGPYIESPKSAVWRGNGRHRAHDAAGRAFIATKGSRIEREVTI